MAESLNGRGLRDRSKRVEIFDRIKNRNTDIILLQQTHWTENDYTDLKDDWNIEFFLYKVAQTHQGEQLFY